MHASVCSCPCVNKCPLGEISSCKVSGQMPESLLTLETCYIQEIDGEIGRVTPAMSYDQGGECFPESGAFKRQRASKGFIMQVKEPY